LLGLNGNDKFSVQSPVSLNTKVSIEGGQGSDLLVVDGNSGAASFSGDNSDVVQLTGTPNADTVNLADGAGNLLLSLNGVTQTLVGNPKIDVNTLAGADIITLSSSQSLNINANAGDDEDTITASGLTGVASNIRLSGNSGNDAMS
ncbi:MAG: hypothetical protein ACK559_35995, partial [bacterium]